MNHHFSAQLVMLLTLLAACGCTKDLPPAASATTAPATLDGSSAASDTLSSNTPSDTSTQTPINSTTQPRSPRPDSGEPIVAPPVDKTPPNETPEVDAPPENDPPPAEAAGPIEASAIELCNAMASDKKAAQAEYVGREIIATAVCRQGVLEAQDKERSIWAQGREVQPPIYPVIRFVEADADQAMRLSPGQKFKFQGKCSRFGILEVYFDECKLLEVGDGPAIKITAKQLAAAVKADEEAARAKFNGQPVLISGKVTEVASQIPGVKDAVKLDDGGEGIYVHYSGNKQSNYEPPEVGDQVTIRGVCGLPMFVRPVVTGGVLIAEPAEPLEQSKDRFRRWTSADGQFTIEAELVKAIGPTVYLKRKDGSEIQVPIDKLSEDDQKFITGRP